MKNTTILYTCSLSLVGLVILSFLILSSASALAGTSTISTATVTVSETCMMTGTLDTPHTAKLVNGTYSGINDDYDEGIGQTTLKVFCNDGAGFAIYAIGYTNDEYGNNYLHWNKASSASDHTEDIATGIYNPNTTVNSTWSMRLLAIDGTYAATIDDGVQAHNGSTEDYTDWHEVPDAYQRVAYRTSGTDVEISGQGIGSSIAVTYDAYVSGTQSPGTYTGQVKYTLVHPSTHVAPVANPATLDTGRTVNAKLKSLAATVVNGEETTITPEFDPEGVYDWDNACDYHIESISVHLKTPAPVGFIPTETNTISSSSSEYPIYVVFDTTDELSITGIMNFYTEGEHIVLSPDSSFMFYLFTGLTEISGIDDWSTSDVTDMRYMFYGADNGFGEFALDLSSWDTSSVTNMSSMFDRAGIYSSSWTIGDVSSWDTSSVTDMNFMFREAGYSATTFTLDLSLWNTSSVTDMSYMFYMAGYSATTFTLNLSSWNTSSVTDMSYMFYHAGYSATTFTLNLSSWNTSSVTDMSYMFNNAGYSATTWSIGDLSSWDTSNVTNMSHMFESAGSLATTWSVGSLSSWNTSSVTSMDSMFFQAGYSATTFTLNLSSWNTSSVMYMSSMFRSAGYHATTWSVGDLSSWNTSSVTSMSSMFEGAGSYAASWTVGDLSSWNTSSVMNMSRIFSGAGHSATTFTLNLSSWNTSSVTNMGEMFENAGYSATTWSVGNLSSWNTSSVTNMAEMFQNAGYTASTFTLDLSSWDTSSVKSMNNMFRSAGYSATTFTLGLSSWNTSSVTNMGTMFNNAGYSATTWSVTIPQTNGNSISNTTSRLYGQRNSIYGTPPSGRTFTLAQP